MEESFAGAWQREHYCAAASFNVDRTSTGNSTWALPTWTVRGCMISSYSWTTARFMAPVALEPDPKGFDPELDGVGVEDVRF